MASTLTSTSIKSVSIYFVFLLITVLGIFYWLVVKQPSSSIGLAKQAFFLNASAFKNGILLANSKFNASPNRTSSLNRWVINDIGLDFNQKGFPIGTNIENPKQQHPLFKEHCRQIWQFVLSPLQPKLYSSAKDSRYWVALDKNSTCVYKRSNLKKLSISYHSETGAVFLHE